MPELLLLQLSAFRQLDPDADWLDRGVIDVTGDSITTRLGESKAQGGNLDTPMRLVFDRVRALGGVLCHVTGVMPCLHDHDVDHEVYDIAEQRYCEIEAPVAVWVPVTVSDSDAVKRSPDETP